MDSIRPPDNENSTTKPTAAEETKTNGTATSSMPSNVSLFVPTLLQMHIVILAVYPLTILLGTISNYPPDSYFALKSNFINVFFLKFGWAWTTVAFIPHLLLLQNKVAPLTRYAAATIWWYLVTQWCFGPPIMDKVINTTCSTLTIGLSRDRGIMSTCEERGSSRYFHFSIMSIEWRRLERRP